MPLDKSLLESGINAAFAVGAVPPPGHGEMDAVMALIATAYNAYALTAQHCGALPPSKVNKGDLEDALKASGALYEKEDWGKPAQEWADGCEAFWDGGEFGGTGKVTEIPGTSALKSAIEGIFQGAASSNGAITMTMVATQLATAMDAFTKLVLAEDTALPAPSGCPPTPIS